MVLLAVPYTRLEVTMNRVLRYARLCDVQGMNISPQGQQPSAISVNMAPDAPEDAAAAAQNLADMQELWTAWHCFGQRKLKGEQVGQPRRLEALAGISSRRPRTTANVQQARC